MNLRLASAVAGAIQLSIYDSSTMVGGGGVNVGYGTEVLEQTYYKSLLLLILCAWTERLGDCQA